MPMLQISATFATEGTMPRETHVGTVVSDEVLARLIPEMPTSGVAGWAHWNEAEELICPIMKRKLFPEESAPGENAQDLRKLGLWLLKVKLQDEKGNSNSLTLINDEREET